MDRMMPQIGDFIMSPHSGLMRWMEYNFLQLFHPFGIKQK